MLDLFEKFESNSSYISFLGYTKEQLEALRNEAECSYTNGRVNQKFQQWKKMMGCNN